jgi:methionine-rich copper-binding protein CopC
MVNLQVDALYLFKSVPPTGPFGSIAPVGIITQLTLTNQFPLQEAFSSPGTYDSYYRPTHPGNGTKGAYGFHVYGTVHERLVKSDPPARAVLATAPKELRLWFNEAVEPAFAKVWIVPGHGAQIPLTSHGDSSDPRLLIVKLPDDLAAGPVVIGYHILSVDGHVVDSQLTFTIKKPA